MRAEPSVRMSRRQGPRPYRSPSIRLFGAPCSSISRIRVLAWRKTHLASFSVTLSPDLPCTATLYQHAGIGRLPYDSVVRASGALSSVGASAY